MQAAANNIELFRLAVELAAIGAGLLYFSFRLSRIEEDHKDVKNMLYEIIQRISKLEGKN